MKTNTVVAYADLFVTVVAYADLFVVHKLVGTVTIIIRRVVTGYRIAIAYTAPIPTSILATSLFKWNLLQVCIY
jgi:hypothetical protein